jgi:ribosomal protein L17
LRQLSDAKSRLDGLILQEQQRTRLLREAASDNQLQESIHRSMYLVLDSLETGDIPAALRVLSEGKASARFHNTANIKGQLCTPADAFNHPLQELTNLAKEFKRSANSDALNFAKRITQLVQQSTINTTTPGKNRLYSSYEKEIEKVIKENLEANWTKFHARSAPEDLLLKIAAQIVERFKPIGNKRWAADLLTFTGWPNLSLINYSALLLEIADSIKKYVSLNPMQLQKPFLDTFLQPYVDERNKTRATVV